MVGACPKWPGGLADLTAMITEHALLTIVPGKEEAFLAAFAEGRKILERQPGALRVDLLRGIESPSTFLLLIEWERLEDHMEGFRNSPDFGAWRGTVGPFFAEGAKVEHFRTA